MYRLVLGAAVGLLLCAPAIAHAEASLYPARDTLDFAAPGEPFVMEGIDRIRCIRFDVGAASIPAEPENRSATTLRVNLSTTPTYTNCSDSTTGNTATIATSGTWTTEFTWGAPAAIGVTAPARGVSVEVFEGGRLICTATNEAGATASGTWQNGFTAPTFVNSIASFSTTITLRWTRGNERCGLMYSTTLRFSERSVQVRDASNERAVILVGP